MVSLHYDLSDALLKVTMNLKNSEQHNIDQVFFIFQVYIDRQYYRSQYFTFCISLVIVKHVT